MTIPVDTILYLSLYNLVNDLVHLPNPTISIVHLFDICQTFFVFFFKSVRIFLGNAKLFFMSTTLFISSSFILPAIRRQANFGSNAWLWIPLNIVNHQSFGSFSKKQRNLNGQSYFLSSCLHASVSSSSLVLKKWGDVYFRTAKLGNTSRSQLGFSSMWDWKGILTLNFTSTIGLILPEASTMVGFGLTPSSIIFSTITMSIEWQNNKKKI